MTLGRLALPLLLQNLFSLSLSLFSCKIPPPPPKAAGQEKGGRTPDCIHKGEDDSCTQSDIKRCTP
ncbi:Protein CBG26724 [Caenorhabditis briggsae]|uniref:Protein CBG26724 n=1 Tax=Caenorhabditis briggsae TaxID=6238 RepID=B6IE99_CAEBR|nr:Protein CBG26724 [Caenorhabditis briggsae]CAS01163.1 Protein CBG26724 [Caenorhabditis briggsae]